MPATFIKTLATAATALVISAASLSTPAMAGGQFSFSFAPQGAQEQQVLGLGLLALDLVNGVSEPGATVRQNGNFNSAGFNQQGRNNTGLIVQDGNGHQGSVEQRGNNNNCALFQFGNNSQGQCGQFGDNQSGVTTVFGF
jgi:minor curlin subunit